MSVRRMVIITPLDTNKNVIKMDKLAGVMEMALSLDKFDNTNNLEDESLRNVPLRHHMTGSDTFMCFKQFTPQYK